MPEQPPQKGRTYNEVAAKLSTLTRERLLQAVTSQGRQTQAVAAIKTLTTGEEHFPTRMMWWDECPHAAL